MKNNTVVDTRRNAVIQRRIDLMKSINGLAMLDNPTEQEEYREPLCVDTFVSKKIFLSFSGPTDGVILYFMVNDDRSLTLVRGVYFFSDWGIYEESDLQLDEAEAVYQFYLGGEVSI